MSALSHLCNANYSADNEYFQSGFGNAEYFQELEDAYRAGGIVIPLTYNDPGEGKNFVNGTVSVCKKQNALILQRCYRARSISMGKGCF